MACACLTQLAPQAIAIYIQEPACDSLNLVDWSHRLYTSAECNGQVDVQVLHQQPNCCPPVIQIIQVHVCRVLKTDEPDHYSPVFVDDDVIVISKTEVRIALHQAGLLDVDAVQDMEEVRRILWSGRSHSAELI